MTNRERRDTTRKEVLDGILSIEVAQECPNTFVLVEVQHRDAYYSAFGFAKVQWPDKWNSGYGIKMAVSKAVMKIVRAIIAGIPLDDEFDTLLKSPFDDPNE